MDNKPKLETGLDSAGAERILERAHEVGAFLTGEFTLTSGKKSNFYFDGKRLTLDPEGVYNIGSVIFDQLVDSGINAVGGVATGAYAMVAAVAAVSHIKGKPIPSFIIREAAKEHGTKRRIEGHLEEGSRVAIVDDVLTTGGSVLKAVEAVESLGCQVVKIVVLVDRCEGGGDELKKRGYDYSAILNVVS